eukprot:CAMPEP_0168198536 /NCGR_PEP_ID=MMETSP0139_2-20121125/21844_1 /TAXON_ID=44445 /ORGANISM="Pseudo-nitzschia australis, Strain 10249 10 AB" /LENGTH=70 /DNA_ID=CAMNT_0008123269 /DNA_START=106 /DNA_END=314 /DNA_ORIENTATION=-
MPSSSHYTAHRIATFSLDVTVSYGADNETEDELNKACSKTTFGLNEMASSFFSGTSSSTAASSSPSPSSS